MKTSLLILLFWAVTAHNVLLGQTPGASGGLVTNIPIHNVSGNGVDIPVRLDWVAPNGIRPDEHPGWVGNGFTLQAGGSVQRIVRGATADEFEVGSISQNVDDDYPRDGLIDGPLSIGYLYHSATLNNINSDDKVFNAVNRQRRFYEPAPETVIIDAIINFFANIIMINVNLNRGNKEHLDIVDMEPDLFSFNCNGFVGTFVATPETSIRNYGSGNSSTIQIIDGFRCIEDPTIKIEASTYCMVDSRFRLRPSDSPVSTTVYDEVAGGLFTVTRRVITGYKITLGNGTVFSFGNFAATNFDESDPTVEFSHNFFGQTKFFSPTTEWYLNRIHDHNGVNLASFAYEKDKYTIDYAETHELNKSVANSNGFNLDVIDVRGGSKFGKIKAATLKHKSYLRRITTEYQTVEFERSLSSQLEMDYHKLSPVWPVIEPYVFKDNNFNFSFTSLPIVANASEFTAMSYNSYYPYVFGDFCSPDRSIPSDTRLELTSSAYYNSNFAISPDHPWATVSGSFGPKSVWTEVIDESRLGWYQLDRIVVKNAISNLTVGSYELNYVNQPNERLRLGGSNPKGVTEGNSRLPLLNMNRQVRSQPIMMRKGTIGVISMAPIKNCAD